MSAESSPLENGIDRKLTAAGNVLIWCGQKVRLQMERGVWRARSRNKRLTCDIVTGTASLVEAKRIVKKALDERPVAKVGDTKSLQFLADTYLAAPKRSSDSIAKRNVCRLKSVVRDAAGTTLDGFKISDLPDLWPAYVARRQTLPRPDYATRRDINRGINSAMRQAACLLTRALEPVYARAGIILPPHAGRLLLAAEIPKTPAPANDTGLLAAWEALRETNVELWLTVGLARFAGLRQAEIYAFRGKWAVTRGTGAYIELRDRPEDQYQHKTGKPYRALILHAGLAQYLLAMDEEVSVVPALNAFKWIQRAPQAWLKPYTGAAKAPLHRLRGLYADQIKRETEQAILARAAGIKAASEALGHTTTGTTVDHYLDALA